MKTYVLFLLIIIFGFLIGAHVLEKTGAGEKMDLTGKSVLMIIAHENFRDEEFEEPYKILTGANANVTVASSSISEARGMLGKTVKPDTTIDKINVNDFDAIIFVGGSGASQYFDDNTALNIAKEGYARGKIVSAICIAPSILANAGILDGKKVTSFPSEQSNLESHGAIYTGNGVEVDGRIITANGPVSAKRFGEEIKKALE